MKVPVLFLALVIFAAQTNGPALPPRKQSGAPRFKNYPAGPIFRGKPTKLNWPSWYPQYEFFKVSIQSLIDGGVNFASHYAVREWSCGTDCHWLVVLDMKTGTFLQALPYGALSVTYEDPSPYGDHDWLQFRPDSRLLIASGCFDVESTRKFAECGTKYFELRGTRFLLLKYVPRPTPEFLTRDRVVLELSSEQPVQGSLVSITVRSGAPLANVDGEWAGRTVSFWRDDSRGTVYRAYLGVDLEQPAGDHELTVNVSPSEGQGSFLGRTMTVGAEHFSLERLSVPPEFVHPPPEEVERAQKETEQLHAIYSGRTPERLWAGAFRFPLDGPRRGGNFGRRRILNGEARSPHGGLDIPAPTGTPVHAAQRGRVALAAPFYFSGNTIVLDHGLGVYTFYGHLSQMDVHEGDVVEPGQPIGRVGATGRVTGPHLHWGLMVNESRVNPLQILPFKHLKKKG